MNNYRSLFGLPIYCTTYSDLVKKLFGAKAKKRIIVAPIATYSVVESLFDMRLKSVLRKFTYLVPDSFYLTHSINWIFGEYMKERIYGPTLFNKVCFFAAEHHLKVYICGNEVDKVASSLTGKFAHIQIAGRYDLKMRRISAAEINRLNSDLKSSKPDIVFIGIGSPAQHFLANELKGNRIILCVGAAFNFLTGKEKVAPLWMQQNGLEWLYRLSQNPKRLWKRYLIDSIIFICGIGFLKIKTGPKVTSVLQKKPFRPQNK